MWQSRVIVHLAENEKQAALVVAQAQEHTTQLTDRRLQLIVLSSDGNLLHPMSESGAIDERDKVIFSQLKAPGQTILIGLDGGVKNYYQTIDWPAIFNDIDGMPMRRAELRQRTLRKE